MIPISEELFDNSHPLFNDCESEETIRHNCKNFVHSSTIFFYYSMICFNSILSSASGFESAVMSGLSHREASHGSC